MIDDIDAALSSPCTFTVDYDVVGPECGVNNGSIDLILEGEPGLYTYEWSTGDTTPYVENLDTGSYTVIIRNEVSCTRAINIHVDFDIPCTLMCTEVNTQVFLEGTYDYDDEKMRKTAERVRLLARSGTQYLLGQIYTGRTSVQ